VLASRLYEDELARKAAALVKDPELQMAARAVIARTRYNASDYVAARDILDADFGKGKSIPGLLAGSLLWAAVMSALGHTPAEIMERAQVLHRAAERLAAARSDDAEAIMRATKERLATMEAMVLALSGDYAAAPATMDAGGAALPAANALERVFRLCLDAERLLADGKGLSALAVMSRAIEAAGADHDELYFLTDFLVIRSAAAAIHSGDWQGAETLLTSFVAGSGPSLISFGGGVHAAHGIILLYQGKAAQALNTLSAALEALRLTDPQQLFALTAAMAFAAAAEVGAQAKADLLLADYEAAPAALPRYMHSLAAMAVVYGKARLGNYPGAIAELKRLGHPDPDMDTPGLELDALAFCLELGDTDSAPRLLELRDELEGPRPAAICAYAAAISTDNPADHLEAAKTCEAAELWTFAALAYDAAAHAYRAAGDTLRERMANSQRKRCLDRADDLPGEDAARSDDSLGILTRRERDIVALAVRGLTDRQIAAELQVSVRTVEGHLYRSYAKLNVKGREELPGIGGR
jgi:DNA-binding CsgD family transcriptional regulator